MDKKKVIVYVDGYNFYYGLKHGGSMWKRLYWLDIVLTGGHPLVLRGMCSESISIFRDSPLSHHALLSPLFFLS
ncbi:hypothetical protein [Prevotella sp. tf2-5]|uniref:hypothetical protein n=1 Tax=Prevotella sp. tf2-5 TaxID=1761889 RepID=UPI000B8303E3|nr:hypothetical protein [Prevotella sp. tf2-5]